VTTAAVSTLDPPVPDPEGRRARYVRPYTITAGRTTASVSLPLEATLLRTAKGTAKDGDTALSASLRQVLDTCDHCSVAEVSALASMPIGVARVLVGDLVEQGYVQVQATMTETSTADERIELFERTLRGLRAY
jgi:hypothetical protein